MKKTIVGFCLAIILPTILYAGDIFNIDNSNSEELLNENEFIVCLYEEESSRCSKFIPIFKETAKTVETFSFGLINIKNKTTLNGKIISAGRIPKVFIIKDGVIMENYEGSFDAEDFGLWCRLMSFMYGKKSK